MVGYGLIQPHSFLLSISAFIMRWADMLFMCTHETEISLLALKGFESIIWDRINLQNHQMRKG